MSPRACVTRGCVCVTETISYGEQSETNHESIFSSASGDEKAQASRASHSPKHLLRTPGERDGDRLGARGGVRVFPRGDRDAAPAADARARGAVDEVRGAKSGAANVAGSERALVPPLRRQGRVVASAPAFSPRVSGPTGALQKRVVSRRRREDGGGGREKNKPRGASRRAFGGAPRDARRSGAHPVLPHADFAVNPPSCRFVPTCSQYAMTAFRTFGPAKGFVLTAWRILRCNPWGGVGYDPPRWPPVGVANVAGDLDEE